jgi:hypothetical protein
VIQTAVVAKATSPTAFRNGTDAYAMPSATAYFEFMAASATQAVAEPEK